MSYHVRDVLASAQDPAPPPRTSTDDIIATARRIRARRMTAAATGGAAVAVAVVVAAVAGLGGPSASMPTAGAPSAAAPSSAPLPEFRPVPSVADLLPDATTSQPQLTLPAGFTTVLGEYRVGEYRIGPAGQVTAGFQELPVYRDGQVWQGEDGRDYPLSDATITFYRAGVYDPARLGAEEPDATWSEAFGVSVAGRPGIGREMAYGSTVVGAAGPDRYVRTALAWQYAKDSWATYVPRPLDGSRPRADAVRIAAAVTAEPARQVRVPYRLGHLPAGWQVVAATETPDRVSTTISEVYLHAGPVAGEARAGKVDIAMPGVRIGVFHGDPKNPQIRGKDGAHCYRAACTIVRGDYFIDVEGRFAEGLGEADVQRLVNGLRPVAIADRGAWVPVGR